MYVKRKPGCHMTRCHMNTPDAQIAKSAKISDIILKIHRQINDYFLLFFFFFFFFLSPSVYFYPIEQAPVLTSRTLLKHLPVINVYKWSTYHRKMSNHPCKTIFEDILLKSTRKMHNGIIDGFSTEEKR